MHRPESRGAEKRKLTAPAGELRKPSYIETRTDNHRIAGSPATRNPPVAGSRDARVERSAGLDAADVKAATDLGALISEHVALKQRGRDLIGCCPFHDEKTASFYVHPDRGFFHCFGCNAGGDAFTFIQQLTGASFTEALHHLAERAGIQPRRLAPGSVRRAIDQREREQQAKHAKRDELRQRWRTLIHEHDDAEDECYIVEAARRWNPDHEVTQALTRQLGAAFERRRKLELELEQFEAAERALREQPFHATAKPAVAAGGAR